jgi:hypothetical protein
MRATTARKSYHNAVNRVLEILKTMGAKPLDLLSCRKQVKARIGKMPKGQLFDINLESGDPASRRALADPCFFISIHPRPHEAELRGGGGLYRFYQ